MEDVKLQLTFRDILGYILAYVLWFLVAALGMVALLMVRNAFNIVGSVISSSSAHMWPMIWLMRAIDRFGLVFLGLVWLAYVIFVENHYRTGITAVRIRRFRAKNNPTPPPEVQPRWAGRLFGKLGLEILVPRFLATFIPPVVIALVAYLIEELAFRSLT